MRFRSAVAVAAAGWIAVSLAGVSSAGGEIPAAVPSGVIVDFLEGSRLVVVGEVRGVEAYGGGAYQAEVAVEQTIAGTEPAAVIQVVWEERATSRPPRLATGDRVLLGLQPHAETSRWWAPGSGQASSENRWSIADAGGAFLRRPSAGEAAILEHFLALPKDHRNGPDGVRHLLSLVANAQPPMARAAARRLSAARPTPLAAPVAQLAIKGLARPEETGVPAALVRWIAESQPTDLVAPLDQMLARNDAAPAAVAARGQLPGAFEARLARFAEDARPAMRAAVAGATRDAERWKKLAADEDARVREAAVSRPAPAGGSHSVFEQSLSDPEPHVRIAAARTLAARGDEAVPALQRVSMESTSPARETALAVLGLIESADARQAIATIGRDHDDAGMRALAELALTRELGDVHPVDP